MTDRHVDPVRRDRDDGDVELGQPRLLPELTATAGTAPDEDLQAWVEAGAPISVYSRWTGEEAIFAEVANAGDLDGWVPTEAWR
jgi:hypothetical protein